MKPAPVTHPSAAKKPLVIAIIAIVALVGISLLLFFSDQFVGKAVSVGLEGFAGPVTPTMELNVGTEVTIPIKANLGTSKSVAYLVDLSFPETLVTKLNFDALDEDNKVVPDVGLNLLVRHKYKGSPGQNGGEAAWLCTPTEGEDKCPNAITGNDVTLAEFSFTPDAIGDLPFTLDVKVIDLDTGLDIIDDLESEFTFSVVEPTGGVPLYNCVCTVDGGCDNGFGKKTGFKDQVRVTLKESEEPFVAHSDWSCELITDNMPKTCDDEIDLIGGFYTTQKLSFVYDHKESCVTEKDSQMPDAPIGNWLRHVSCSPETNVLEYGFTECNCHGDVCVDLQPLTETHEIKLTAVTDERYQ